MSLRDPGIQPGDPLARLTAEAYNAVARELERLEALAVAPPLELHAGAGGRALSLAAPRPFLAKLAGPASPYDWTEQVPKPDGSWSTGARSGRANAYEVNRAANLDGAVARLYPDLHGGYRFQFVRFGTCSPFTVRVLGCNGMPLPGAGVTVTDASGDVVAGGTTDASGDFPFPDGAPGATYTFAASAPRFQPRTVPAFFACDGLLLVPLSPADGYVCCPSWAYPVSQRLLYSDVNGEHILTSGGVAQGVLPTWAACYVAPTDGIVLPGSATCTYANGQTPVSIAFGCGLLTQMFAAGCGCPRAGQGTVLPLGFDLGGVLLGCDTLTLPGPFGFGPCQSLAGAVANSVCVGPAASTIVSGPPTLAITGTWPDLAGYLCILGEDDLPTTIPVPVRGAFTVTELPPP